MKTQISVTLDKAKIRELTNSPKGPGGLKMLKIARDTVKYARQYAPRDSGALARSIRILEKNVSMSRGVSFTVGSTLDYAMAVHEGSPAMTIYPRQAKVLKFPGKRDGKVLYRPSVQKKDQPGNPFLRDAMYQAMKGT